jgi:UDP-N-acetylmuramoylalanine--D-glutamate ligase
MSLLAQALDELGVRAQTRILAITGTNGKTTTTALTAALAQSVGIDAVAAGNISPAALDVLMERLEIGAALPACWVLELSSFQIETMRGLAPRRQRCSTSPTTTSTATPTSRNMPPPRRRSSRARACRCSLARTRASRPWRCPAAHDPLRHRGAGERNRLRSGRHRRPRWLLRGGERLLALDELPLAGRHNAANALAALALCGPLGIAPMDPDAGLKAFRGLPHRVELVAERADGVRFYDDSKGTNVGATVAALAGWTARWC